MNKSGSRINIKRRTYYYKDIGFLGLLHMDIVRERLEREYNLCYIQKEVIPKYSIGKDRGGDKLAYKNVPSSIFGLFTNCIKIPNAPNTLA